MYHAFFQKCKDSSCLSFADLQHQENQKILFPEAIVFSTIIIQHILLKHLSLSFLYVKIETVIMMNWKWTRQPDSFSIQENEIRIKTQPYTDLWQRTYYHFRNDNAPVLQIETDKKYFTFQVKTEFDTKHRFDQCGVVMYLDSENWLKASIEYENEQFQHLGSVVTNHGYSDWATTEINASIQSMWYRLSRREDDFCIECSEDGFHFKQMRICHVHQAQSAIQFGIYACSPEDSSFEAIFTHMELMECQWKAHDGQQPD